MPKPKLPTLPVGWQRKPLHEVVTRVTQRNTTGEANALTISARHGLVSQTSYFNRRIVSDDARQYFLLQRGDFAYNKSYSAGYPVGVIRRLDRHNTGIVSPLYICFRPKAGVNSDFLSHYFAAGCLDDQIAWVAKEGVRNHGLLNVGVDDFFNIEIDLPPRQEQQRIANAINSIDDALRASEQVIAKLEIAGRAILEALLSRGTKAVPHQPRDLSAPHTDFPSDTSALPVGWTIETVAEAFFIDDTSRTPISSEVREKMRGEYPYYGPTGVLDQIDRYRYEGTCALIGEDGDHFLKFKEKPMTLLVSGKFNVNNHAHVLRGTARAKIEWFWLYFLHRDITLHLTRQGAGRFKLTRKALGALPIAIPSLPEQDAILRVHQEQQNRIYQEKAYLNKLLAVKRGMVEDLLTGRLRAKIGTGEAV